MGKIVDFSGVKVDNVTLTEAAEIVRHYVIEGKARIVVTPNPEMIVAAQADSELKDIINKADLVIGRAGANTISDLASTGKPSILIPLPISAASEQARNAQILEKFGSISLDQKHLTPQLLYSITIKSLKSLDKLSKLALSAKELINRKSAQHIEEILLTVINDSPPQKAKTI